jgi:hypothetical protein
LIASSYSTLQEKPTVKGLRRMEAFVTVSFLKSSNGKMLA